MAVESCEWADLVDSPLSSGGRNELSKSAIFRVWLASRYDDFVLVVEFVENPIVFRFDLTKREREITMGQRADVPEALGLTIDQAFSEFDAPFVDYDFQPTTCRRLHRTLEVVITAGPSVNTPVQSILRKEI